MRVALVCPYSYTYPGGVVRHVEALARECLRAGHEVRLLAPFDPDDRHARIGHGGARPERRELPDHVVPLGRTVGVAANGAVSNIAITPSAVAALDRELRRGRYDVVHVHEPNVPALSWFAAESARAPLVATFHTYASGLPSRFASGPLGARRLYNKLHVRIAVSEAARWTAERFYGGRYRIVPNGVDAGAAPAAPAPSSDELRIAFVGRAEERKGLPVLLRAFEALRASGVRARLVVAGPTPQEVAPYLLDPSGVEVLGRVGEEEKWRVLHSADVLCAPSLGGESFGMVLIEALAAGTPVVCSDIGGYRDVVREGVDGVLAPPGDPAALGEALRGLALDPGRRARMAGAAREGARRFAWQTVTGEVIAAYEDATRLHAARPATRAEALARRAGVRAADGLPLRAPVRRAAPEPAAPEPAAPVSRRRRALRVARRAAVPAGLAGAVALAVIALARIGVESIGGALLAAAPVWVVLSFALMCASMLLRAESWHAILRAALPGMPVRRGDTARAVMIGVLMSATLPARLGEPSRALIVARRLGRVRERLPVVLGTIVSQTLLNLLALAILGAVMLATVGLFRGGGSALAAAIALPLAALALAATAAGRVRSGRALVQVRRGLEVFRRPRLGAWAAAMQLLAWGIQWLACHALLVALGLGHVGVGAAAAVLFAVNVTAALPATPSNVGVFQAACVAVLAAYGVGHAEALAYGIILQALEIATAFALGMPALVREGTSWRDMRVRALHATPVELAGPRRAPEPAEAEA